MLIFIFKLFNKLRLEFGRLKIVFIALQIAVVDAPRKEVLINYGASLLEKGQLNPKGWQAFFVNAQRECNGVSLDDPYFWQFARVYANWIAVLDCSVIFPSCITQIKDTASLYNVNIS